MNKIKDKHITILDLKPPQETFLDDVLRGLLESQKELLPKYFYNERGSHLFERICEQKEYYPTDAEISIMRTHAAEMAELIGEDCLLIELGSGSSTKTRFLLNCLKHLAAYVPVDISKEHLRHSAVSLMRHYPAVEVLPVCADFSQPLKIPVCDKTVLKKVVYFPGSTIGNFKPSKVSDFLRNIAGLCGNGGGLLIGVDLKKDAKILELAYNDAEGVTGDFNLNLLIRINRELGGDFKLDQFRHHAFYDEKEGRIEMHLVSLKDQTVTISDVKIPFKKDESIRTEYSHNRFPSMG